MNDDPQRADEEEENSSTPASRGYALPTHRAWLTRVLLVLNLVVYGAMWVVGNPDDNICLLLRFGAKFNLLIIEGQWWRLLTPIFLHGGITHLLFNEYALWIYGNEVERLFGTVRFALVYLLAGLFGSWASFTFSPAISVGASGAIFGIIGALAAFFLRNRERFGEMGRRQLSGLILIIAINLFLGFGIARVDNFAHMGGLASGFVLGFTLTPRYELVGPDYLRGIGPRVVDTSSSRTGAWAIGVALFLLVGLIMWGLTAAPVGPRDVDIAARCFL